MGKTLVFQGDSITDCGRATCGGAGYPMYDLGPGYAGIIASKLLAESPEKNWNIINRGISGDRCVDLYARWKKDCVNFKPDILSILLGINDIGHEINHCNGVDAKRFDQFYRMLLDWARDVNPQLELIIMEPFAFNFGFVNDSWLPELKIRQEIVKKIAADYSAAFIPLQSIFDAALTKAPQEHWMVDGIHPTNAGHGLIVKAWLEAAGDLI